MKIKNVFYIGLLFGLQESFAPPKNQEAKAEFKGLKVYNNGRAMIPDNQTIVRKDDNIQAEYFSIMAHDGVYCIPHVNTINEEITYTFATENQIRAMNKIWQTRYPGKYFLIQEGDKHVCFA